MYIYIVNYRFNITLYIFYLNSVRVCMINLFVDFFLLANIVYSFFIIKAKATKTNNIKKSSKIYYKISKKF